MVMLCDLLTFVQFKARQSKLLILRHFYSKIDEGMRLFFLLFFLPLQKVMNKFTF